MKRLGFLLLCLVAVAFSSCSDEYPDYAYVNFYIDPESSEYYNLNYGHRGWEYFEGGARGVVVFRKSWDEFIAFERTCVAKNCHGRLAADIMTVHLLRAVRQNAFYIPIVPILTDYICG